MSRPGEVQVARAAGSGPFGVAPSRWMVRQTKCVLTTRCREGPVSGPLYWRERWQNMSAVERYGMGPTAESPRTGGMRNRVQHPWSM